MIEGLGWELARGWFLRAGSGVYGGPPEGLALPLAGSKPCDTRFGNVLWASHHLA